ncbi:hypothetical protein MHK_000031 [Candidatus Magnetomorum sp. HK-1]|nr:hypothetical protein MHK_000031 [Candidatus Magnetomorum sp. HK-1]
MAVTLSPLTKPISPSVQQQQPKKPYSPQEKETTDETINLQNKEIVKSNVQVLPPGAKKSAPIKFKENDNNFQESQKAAFKEKELNLKRAELPLAREEDREKLRADIYQLNLKLEQLKQSEKGPNIQGAQFRLGEDDNEFYVELINVEQDTVIKELSVESLEDVLRQTSDKNNMGVLLDLFA